MEPNPFEQSFIFDGKTQQPANGYRKSNVLPPAATIDTPTDGNPSAASNNPLWDSLRTGELSPSMITAPRANMVQQQPQMGQGMAPGGANNHLMPQAAAMTNYPNSYQNNQSVQPNNLYVLSAAQQEVMQRSGNLGQHGMAPIKQEADEHGMAHSRMHQSPPVRQRTTTSPESSADDSHRRRYTNRRSSSVKRTDTDDGDKRKNFLERNRQGTHD